MLHWLLNLLRQYVHRDPLPFLTKQGLVVGKHFMMLEDVVIDPSHCWLVTIGDEVTLAPRVHILAHDASTKRHLNYTRLGKVTIGNRVFIGASTLILPGVTIGSDVVVGAGSVVTHDVPSGVVVAGNPARVIGSLEDFLARRKSEMETSPLFGDEYTIRGNVSDAMKADMVKLIKGRYAYVS
ncbi:acyltransferase [Nitrospira sp. BLG_2]|uniref:Bacterial transferase hexapeptide repeat protein n=2 Tax=Nitrospira tepida TaxID=2973512 RepID=A0AA86N3N4_9BACT|nr:Bacterial transferase hexapeptide repeat protein [Nitrospira tepida]